MHYLKKKLTFINLFDEHNYFKLLQNNIFGKILYPSTIVFIVIIFKYFLF